jgi:hypothetical protein
MRAVSVSMGERKAASRKLNAAGKYKNSQKLKAKSPKQRPEPGWLNIDQSARKARLYRN